MAYLSVESVMARANERYRKVRGRDMESEQIKSLCEALVEEIRDYVQDEIGDLYRHMNEA